MLGRIGRLNTRHTGNGPRASVVKVEGDPGDMLAVLRVCRRLHRDHGAVPKADIPAIAQELADLKIFSVNHIAKILGTTAQTLRRKGVVQEGKKLGGAFDPAQLRNIIISLNRFQGTGRYSAQHIKLAYEGGVSAPMLARLIGCSAPHVLKLVRNADDYDRRTEEFASAGSGRPEASETADSGHNARAVRPQPVPAGLWKRASERRGRARQRDTADQRSAGSYAQPRTADRPTGRHDRARSGLQAGAEARAGGSPAPP